ncbi:MAG: hypothetical protein HY867_19390 [Chloroflexi bacterium]|nr:hypothetical protein [Chloroflexota bacterium]
MIGNILKVIATLVIGYLVGLLLGGFIGILIGIIPSFLIDKVIGLEFSFLVSASLAVIYGGLLGYLEIRIFNRLFDTNDKPYIGALIGIPFGLIFGVFTYFILELSVPEAVNPSNILIYNGAMGSRIGAAIFSLYGAAQTIRELIRFHRGVTKLN